MSTTFSPDGGVAIARPAKLEEERQTCVQRKDTLDIAELYEVDQTASEIQSRHFKRVTNIQAPK